MFPNNIQNNKISNDFHEENATKSLDTFSNQMVMNIMDQISEININPSSNNSHNLEANNTAKYMFFY